MAHQGAQRCQKCKYSRKAECPDGCPFRDFFPPEGDNFQQVIGLYGKGTSSALSHQMDQLPPTLFPNFHNNAYFNSLTVDGGLRRDNRVVGSSGNIQVLEMERHHLKQGQQYFQNEANLAHAQNAILSAANEELVYENNWFRNQHPDENPPPFHDPGNQ